MSNKLYRINMRDDVIEVLFRKRCKALNKGMSEYIYELIVRDLKDPVIKWYDKTR